MKLSNKKNIYSIPDCQLNKIFEIIDFYIEIIMNENIKNLNFADSLGELEFLAELIPIASDKELIINKSYEILQHINNEYISKNKYFGFSLYEGLTNLARIVSRLYDNTGYFLQVKNSLNTNIIVQTNRLSQEYIKNMDKVTTEHFDAIKGVAGSLSYLLQYDAFTVDCNISLDFLLEISKKIEYKKRNIPGWFIRPENNTNNEYTELYPDGYINYSLSHGIGGVFATFDIALRKHIYENTIENAVNNIFNEYLDISARCGKDFVSGIIDINDYYSMKNKISAERQSWCYGTSSILYHILRVGISTNNVIMIQTATNILENYKQNKFGLFSPVICHGFAGTMTVYRKIYDILKDEITRYNMLELLDMLLKSYNSNLKYGFIDTYYRPINGKIEKIKKEQKDFLTGSSGILLSLLSFITDTKYESALLLN